LRIRGVYIAYTRDFALFRDNMSNIKQLRGNQSCVRCERLLGGLGAVPQGGLSAKEKLSVLWALTGKTATPRASPLMGCARQVGPTKAGRALVGMACASRVSGSAAGHRRSVTGATPGGLPPFKQRQSTQSAGPGERTMHAMCGGRSRSRCTRLRAK
jgi:hypothetical protein